MGLAEQLDEASGGGGSSILEASLGRIWQHHDKTGFVIITAWRGDQDEKANRQALQRLKGDVRGAGYGFIPLEGVGQEKHGGKIVQASEPSLLIPNKRKGDVTERREAGDDLRRRALAWGKKYKQFAVLVHDPKTGTEILKPGGGVVARARKFSANTASEFFTRLKGGRTFTLEWWGIKYGEPHEGWMDGAARELAGQTDIAECSDRIDEWMVEMGIDG